MICLSSHGTLMKIMLQVQHDDICCVYYIYKHKQCPLTLKSFTSATASKALFFHNALDAAV